MERLPFRLVWKKVNSRFHLEKALARVQDSRRRPHSPGHHPAADTFVNSGDTVDVSTLVALFPPIWRTLQQIGMLPAGGKPACSGRFRSVRELLGELLGVCVG